MESYWKYNIRYLSLESEYPNDDIDDEQFNCLRKAIDSNLLPAAGHRVLILQPNRRYGKLHLKQGSDEQSLLEARALVNTLRSWVILDEEVGNTRTICAARFFSKGNYEQLTEKFKNRNDISAIFVNFTYLSALQIMTLERDWQKTIYDRYMMVLQIFKLHAKTSEAKIQVQLAEMPYFRSRLYGYHNSFHSDNVLSQLDKSLNGLGVQASTIEEKYKILKNKEHKLQEKIHDLEKNRDVVRGNRRKSNIPILSVVGYTNAGKTALIRHLTKDEKIEPRNCYFATLDVTYHDFFMKLNENNFGMKSLLIDTIGFMSDIPTNLIAAFRSTLKESVDTDLIVHVVDLSNEFWMEQMDFTLQTLQTFQLPEKLMNSIITVGTKIDQISNEQLKLVIEKIPNLIPISNVSGENINLLHATISKSLQSNVNFIYKRLKVKQGSNIYQWIQSNAIIQNQEESKDNEKILIDVIFLPSIWAKFQHSFFEK